METETIDRLFLELAQVTKARTPHEIRLEQEMEAHRLVGCTVSMETTLQELAEARGIARRLADAGREWLSTYPGGLLQSWEQDMQDVLAAFDALHWPDLDTKRPLGA